MDRETVEEIKRHFSVVVEDQDSKIQLLAEGLGARVDGLSTKIDGLDAKIDRVDRKVDGLTQIVQLMHSELTGRLNDHETRLDALERRHP
jgi:hypothetical protein